MGLVLNIDKENIKDIMNKYFKNASLITLIREEEKFILIHLFQKAI